MQMNLSKKDKLWYAFIAIAVILPCIPGVIGGSFFGHVATMVLLYASMAQSWNIISGYGGQVSFGHSVFFGIGAYGAGSRSSPSAPCRGSALRSECSPRRPFR